MELGEINTLEDLDNYFNYNKDNEIKLEQTLIYLLDFLNLQINIFLLISY